MKFGNDNKFELAYKVINYRKFKEKVIYLNSDPFLGG